MLRKTSLWLLVILFLSSIVCAHEVDLYLMDLQDKTEIINVLAEARSDDYNHTQFLRGGSRLDLELSEGSRTVYITADYAQTEGKDYFLKQQISVEGKVEEPVYMFPVGSVRGIVKDRSGNNIADANLKFECSNDIGSSFPEKTDSVGSFYVNTMPTGPCRIYATHEKKTSFIDIDLTRGTLRETDIILPIKGYTRYIIAGIITILAIIIVILLLKIRQLKIAAAPKSGDKVLKRRQVDVLATLSSRERKIVEFLMQTGGKNSQAHVRHNTSIPRTSLSRCLNTLEHKNIVSIEEHGKTRKIILTPWFLGKG